MALDTRLSADQAVEHLAQVRRVPRATYRVQFNEDFGFVAAAALVPYWRDLGISHLYASPILHARRGSTHGYDITDYSRLNAALGSPEDFDQLVNALHDNGMGLILDMVPNHMGIDASENRWWRNVLENGPSSRYASFFDINWSPVKPELAGKVLLPILEDQYGAVLESGKISLQHGDAFSIVYGQVHLPVTPDSYADILGEAAHDIAERMPEDNPARQELESILTALRYLPSYTSTDSEDIVERAREKQVIKRRVATLLESSDEVRRAVDDVLARFNNGDPAGLSRLDALLAHQPYRLAFWRVAADEINYRRFFDINDMAAIQIELLEVFDTVHERVFEWLAQGKVNGLRIDHPDGLWHPTAYFRRIQEGYVQARLGALADAIKGKEVLERWIARFESDGGAKQRTWPLYVVAEKILSESEPLPLDWPVDGTTGYDFLNTVNGLFVNTVSEDDFTALYERFIGRTLDFDELIYNSKLLIMDEALSSEIRALSHELERITEGSRRYRDYTLNGLTRAIRAVVASLSIYRTYITGPDQVSERDRRYIVDAVLHARRRNPGVSRLLFTFLRDTLLLTNLDQFEPDERPSVVAFVMKFQQLTGPVMAKSVEDTAFYVYNRLASLNEVGGEPQHFGITGDQFHAHNLFQAEHWPHTMLATSTHDAKRGEDVRARLNVLSEMPDAWQAAIGRWAAHNADKKTPVDGAPAPDANDEYLYYQSLIGVWTEGAATADESLQERLATYMVKAANEAKVHTSWINPDDEYGEALQTFVRSTLQDQMFLDDFLQLQRVIAFYGRLNGLAQTVLKLTAPGVPDIYQGSELWNLNLVDPDNRRPVDYGQRQRVLTELQRADDKRALLATLLDSAEDGRIKLYITQAILQARAAMPELFSDGDYLPLKADGARAEHLVAFLRQREHTSLLVLVPRLMFGLTSGSQRLPVGEADWQDTSLLLPQAFSGKDLLSGTAVNSRTEDGTPRLRPAEVLHACPVAVLISEQSA